MHNRHLYRMTVWTLFTVSSLCRDFCFPKTGQRSYDGCRSFPQELTCLRPPKWAPSVLFEAQFRVASLAWKNTWRFSYSPEFIRVMLQSDSGTLKQVRTAPSRGGLIWPYKGLLPGCPLKRALSRLLPKSYFLLLVNELTGRSTRLYWSVILSRSSCSLTYLMMVASFTPTVLTK